VCSITIEFAFGTDLIFSSFNCHCKISTLFSRLTSLIARRAQKPRQKKVGIQDKSFRIGGVDRYDDRSVSSDFSVFSAAMIESLITEHSKLDALHV
jgi:hypothetical protein